MLYCCLLGLFECQDPSIESRNVSLGEFQKQIKDDNVSSEADTHQGLGISNKSTNTLRLTRASIVVNLVLVSPLLVVTILQQNTNMYRYM